METWRKYLSAVEEDWAYTKIPDENLLEAIEWCEKNCKGKWASFDSRIYVKESSDAVFFLLRWT
jgi:hypothetical protein